mgnify:CR=1 FL=1
MSKIGEMSSFEKMWMETIKNSDIVSGDFTADDVMTVLKTTPLKSGMMPKILPNKCSVQRIMLKSKMFEKVGRRTINHNKTNEWRIKNA